MRGPRARRWWSGNKIVVFGGRTGGKVEADVKQTEVFDGKSWHDAPAIPFPGDHLGAVTDGTYAYAIGGRNLKSSENNNHLQRFDPATNTWTQLTPLPVANSDMGAVYVNGQIVTFGGENAFSVFNTVRSYNVAAKSWSTLANMAQARHGMGGAVVGNTIYAVDGASLPGHAGSTRTLQTFVPPVPAAARSVRLVLGAGTHLDVPGAAAARGGAEPEPDLAGRRLDRLQWGSSRPGNQPDAGIRHGAPCVE